MRNKKVTFPLILVVVGVWGVIIYRVLGSVSSDTVQKEIVKKSKVKTLLIKEDLMPDTFSLILKYRDPFSEAAYVKVNEKTGVTRQIGLIHKEERREPQIDWNFIRYSGSIQSSGGKKPIALVSIFDNQYMLKEGDEVGNIKLVRNLKDSIQVKFQGKMKHIKLN